MKSITLKRSTALDLLGSAAGEEDPGAAVDAPAEAPASPPVAEHQGTPGEAPLVPPPAPLEPGSPTSRKPAKPT